MKRLVSVLLACTMLISVSVAEPEAAESYTVTLVENATTGYLWDYAVSDDTILVVTDNGSVASDTELVGAPGTHSWTVTGAAAGKAAVTFTYSQPWEGGDTGESFIFTFTVDEALHIAILDTQSHPGESDPGMIILTQYEDPDSGLTWGFELSGDGVLQLVKDEYIAAEDEGGKHHWAFQAVGEGNANVTFICLDENDEEQAVVTYGFAVQDSHHDMLADSLQGIDGKLLLDDDDIFILSKDELPLLEEDERLLLSDDGMIILDGDDIIYLSEDDFPFLSDDDFVQLPVLSDALQSATWQDDGKIILSDDDVFILSKDELPLLEEDERLLLSDDGMIILDGDDIIYLSEDDFPILSEDDFVQHPALSDALQSVTWQDDGKIILSDDDIFILSADELPLLEEDERLLLSDDGAIILSGDDIIYLSEDDFPFLSKDDIVQHPALSDALQSAAWQDDGKVILSDDDIFILSADELPLLEEDERLLLSDDGAIILSGDDIIYLSEDDFPFLSEDDIVQHPVLSEAFQFQLNGDDLPILNLQKSDGKVISGNDDLLIIPLSVDGSISFVPEFLQ